jgi:hypothetical protein
MPHIPAAPRIRLAAGIYGARRIAEKSLHISRENAAGHVKAALMVNGRVGGGALQ